MKVKNRIVLVEIYEEHIFYENMGLHRIAAFLEKKGYKVKIVYIKKGTDMASALSLIGDSEVIGIALYDINFKYAKELTTHLKKTQPSCIVFYGSQFVSLTSTNILSNDSNVDFLVLGDGEYPIEYVLDNYNGKNLDILIATNPYLMSHASQNNKRICDSAISEMPWPKHTQKFIRENLYCYVQASNGCLGDCSFCARTRKAWSFRSPEDMVAELNYICERYNIRAFVYSDSSLGDIGVHGKERIQRFLDILENEGKRYAFCCYMRSEAYKETDYDISLLKRMRKNGFVQSFVGIEAGNSQDLILYNKIATVEDNRTIIRLLEYCGIQPLWGFMMFNPYSDENTLRDNFSFLAEFDSYVPVHYLNHVNIYKNTDLYIKAKRDGLIKEKSFVDITYDFKCKSVKKIFDFYQSRYFTTSLHKSARNIRDAVRLFLYLSVVVEDYDEEAAIVDLSKRKLSEINKEYFSYAFLEQNMTLAEKYFNTYLADIKKYSDNLERVKYSMIRRYYRKYGKV